MVRGTDKFRESFTGYEGNYVIIGGTACEMHEEIHAQTPRATRDIDIILIVEALSPDFAVKFWEFVKAAGCRQRSRGTGDGECRHEYYRFKEPGNPDFPYQIELFSWDTGVVKLLDDAHIIPTPVDDDPSSPSATLMDDDYCNYTIEHSMLEEGVHVTNIESLIYLKCRAYLEMTERRSDGERADSKHIAKHKKDVSRLITMFAPIDTHEASDSLKQDVDRLRLAVKEEVSNSDFFKSVGFKSISGE